MHPKTRHFHQCRCDCNRAQSSLHPKTRHFQCSCCATSMQNFSNFPDIPERWCSIKHIPASSRNPSSAGVDNNQALSTSDFQHKASTSIQNEALPAQIRTEIKRNQMESLRAQPTAKQNYTICNESETGK